MIDRAPAWIAFRRRQSHVAHARTAFRPFGCKGSTVSRQPNVLILPVRRPRSRPSGTLRSERRLVSCKEIVMASQNAPQRQRAIQKQVAGADEAHPKAESKQAMQAGARRYPAPPFPRQHQQHQRKPGSEAALNPPPFYDAPFYLGSKKLADKVALITGGDSGIGRAVAILFAREGADIALAYLNEHDDARLTKERVEAEGRGCVLISGDVKSQRFCEKAVSRTIKEFGRLDVLVNNAAFQVHTSRFEDLTAKHFDETLKTNLYGYFFLAQAAVKRMKPRLRHYQHWISDGLARQRVAA